MNNSDNDKKIVPERSQKQNETDTRKPKARVNTALEAFFKKVGVREVPHPKGVEVWIFENPRERIPESDSEH